MHRTCSRCGKNICKECAMFNTDTGEEIGPCKGCEANICTKCLFGRLK